jgi:ribosomal protein L32
MRKRYQRTITQEAAQNTANKLEMLSKPYATVPKSTTSTTRTRKQTVKALTNPSHLWVCPSRGGRVLRHFVASRLHRQQYHHRGRETPFPPQVHLDPSRSSNQGHPPTPSSPDINPSRRLLRASTELSTCDPAPETQRSTV